MTAITFQFPFESFVRWMITEDKEYTWFFVDYESSILEYEGVLDQLTAINNGWA